MVGTVTKPEFSMNPKKIRKESPMMTTAKRTLRNNSAGHAFRNYNKGSDMEIVACRSTLKIKYGPTFPLKNCSIFGRPLEITSMLGT